MYKKTLLIFGLGFLALLVFTAFNHKSETDNNTASIQNQKTINIGGEILNVEVADTPDKQVLGLSYRTSMVENHGMLFIFPLPETPSFWMKDMHFPLDMLWADKSGKIVAVTKNISPDTYPATFQPPSPVLYVIEVNAGWSDRNNIKPGDIVRF